VRLCARCLGVYPGIAVGLGLFLFGVFNSYQLLLVAFLPMPALVDWTVTHLRTPDGRNAIRTATGALLGVGYGIGLGQFVIGREPVALFIGLCYGALAGLALLADSAVDQSR